MKKIKIKLNSWIYNITIAAFIITIIISYITAALMANTGTVVAIFVVLVIILIGIFFDTVGVAVAVGTKTPFHSMAASNIKSAKYSILLLNNASKVSNFLNDVIGDIAGIISGAASTLIVTKIMFMDVPFLNKTIVSVLLSSLVACLTIGGKAVGKELAITYSKEIVNIAGKVVCFINEKTFLKILKNV